jgi:diguanylate cyclase (GGDEF)-like protein
VVAGAASENRDFQSLEKSLQQVAIAVKKVQDYQCLHSIDRKLQELAALDELTQLANRHYFEEYLKQQWRRMEREQESISLIICDIDSFGNFNRIHGEREGDEYLQKLATVMALIVKRPSDLVARYDGEEFVVLLPYTEADGAIHVANKIHEKIQFLKPNKTSDIKADLGVSLGVASGTPTPDFHPSVLLQKARNALQQAQKDGGNRVHFINL